MENKKLPENWCVKNDGSKLFIDTVIKYINKTNDPYGTHAGYTGICHDDYYGFNDGLFRCLSWPFGTVLTIDEFIDIVCPWVIAPKMKDFYSVSRNDLEKLYKSADTAHRYMIKDIVISNPFGNLINVSRNDIAVFEYAKYTDGNTFKDTFPEYYKDLKNIRQHKLSEALNKIRSIIEEGGDPGFKCEKIMLEALEYKPE